MVRLSKMLDLSLLVQAAPILFITLAGMVLTAILFDISVRMDKYKKYPIILEAGCILSFKGNVELGLAVNISSLRRGHHPGTGDFFRMTFFNVNFLLAQACIIGVFSGIIGGVHSSIKNGYDSLAFVRIVTGVIFICVATSLLFMVILLMILEVALKYGIEPENFILPLLSAVNDYVIVRGLLFAAIVSEQLHMAACIATILGLFVFFAINLFFTIRAEKLLPLNSIVVLGTSYMISILTAYLVDRFSSTISSIAFAFPVFSGMCGAIAFIHIHRKCHFSPDELQIPQYPTLMVLSFAVSLFFLILSKAIGMGYTLLFSSMFILVFCGQVLLTLVISEQMKWDCKEHPSKSFQDMLPMISSLTDFFSSLVLIGIAFMFEKRIPS